MLRYILILIIGIGGFCELLSGALCGIDCQYVEGTFRLLSGYLLVETCIAIAKY